MQVLDRSEAELQYEETIWASPPEVTEEELEQQSPTHHTFKELGISFVSPIGWLVQTPAPTSPESPQIAVVGPKTSTSMPAISFRMDPSTMSLEQEVEVFRQQIQALIDCREVIARIVDGCRFEDFIARYGTCLL